MSIQISNEETEKMVLELGLATPETLEPYKAQVAQYPNTTLFDILVMNGLIPYDLLKELNEGNIPTSLPESAEPPPSRPLAPPPPPPPPIGARPSGVPAAAKRKKGFEDFDAPPAAPEMPVYAPPPAPVAAHKPPPPAPPPPPRAPEPEPEPEVEEEVMVNDGSLVTSKIAKGWPKGIAPDDTTPGHIQEYLLQARKIKASDIHFSVSIPPMIRVFGAIKPLKEGHPPLQAEDTERLVRGALTPEQWEQVEKTGDLDYCYSFPRGGRFRVNILRDRNGLGFVARVIGEKIFTIEELGLPPQVKRLTEYAQGLVLVTGPSGHGKTTTMMALVDLVNAARPDHIITVEDPIEFLVPGKKCQVSQREVGPHTVSFASALKAALRENPDIITIGELRDYETTSMAISAAETGHLVFGSLPTQDAAKTIDKVLDSFPPEEQTQIRLMVSESIRGIISQQLIPRKDGSGRVAAVELLFNSVPVANIIREANTGGLVNAMQLGKNQGMVLMDDSLQALVDKGLINGEEAFLRANNRAKFKQFAPAGAKI